MSSLFFCQGWEGRRAARTVGFVLLRVLGSLLPRKAHHSCPLFVAIPLSLEVRSRFNDEDAQAVSRRSGSATVSVFSGCGTDGTARALVRDDLDFHLEDPTPSEVELFFAPPPDMDQEANSLRNQLSDISS